jgi:hypothetical protein
MGTPHVTILVATSVVRGSPEGGSHGAVHLIDLDRGRAAQLIDWNAGGVDWLAAGGGRGLRGVAFDPERVFIAASERLLVFTPDFELLQTYRSPYLGQAHEMAIFDRRLYLTSTGFDSVLGFDLDANRFDWGLHIAGGEAGFQGTPFDPQGVLGPPPGNALQLNSIYCDARGMFISGARTLGMLYFDARRIVRLVTLPQGVQNARPWRDGVLFNDTAADVVRFLTPASNRVFQVPHYPAGLLTAADAGDARIARQGFARGLCVIDQSMFASGSSPATVTLHDLDTMKTTLSINLSTDIRHTIHTLAVWPYPVVA